MGKLETMFVVGGIAVASVGYGDFFKRLHIDRPDYLRSQNLPEYSVVGLPQLYTARDELRSLDELIDLYERRNAAEQAFSESQGFRQTVEAGAMLGGTIAAILATGLRNRNSSAPILPHLKNALLRYNLAFRRRQHR